jgi:hypothetical protein
MEPTFNDYVALIYNRFDAFVQSSDEVKKLGHPYVYQQESMIVFFMWMQFKKIYQFKPQWRWLTKHREALLDLKWEAIPHRVTLSRRYKALYSVIQELIAFVGESSEALGDEMSHKHLNEDQSLFKAQGTVWHQSDRKQGRIPEKLRNLDVDATWSKSGYHGWVYGYGLHLTSNSAGFPILVEVETATFSEKQAIERKQDQILHHLNPFTICGDDAYTQAMRIRRWATQGVIWVVPALRWKSGRYAQAYHQFLKQDSEIAMILRQRKTAIEPIFDLIAKLLGTTGKQKQLFKQNIQNVRTHLALAVLSLQVAMIANQVWNMPFRNISCIKGVFA